MTGHHDKINWILNTLASVIFLVNTFDSYEESMNLIALILEHQST